MVVELCVRFEEVNTDEHRTSIILPKFHTRRLLTHFATTHFRGLTSLTLRVSVGPAQAELYATHA
jgi:hypothetical protein